MLADHDPGDEHRPPVKRPARTITVYSPHGRFTFVIDDDWHHHAGRGDRELGRYVTDLVVEAARIAAAEMKLGRPKEGA